MFISFVLLYLVVHAYRLQKNENAEGLESFIFASIFWCVFLYGTTEALSVFYLLQKNVLLYVWVGLAFLLTLFLFLWKKHLTVWKLLKNTAGKLKNMRLHHIGIAFGALFVLNLSFRIIPYNYDSMTYHLSRICHWTQNQSVSHYATNIIRQVTSPVLHEFINLHVYILSDKKDNLLNLLQCFSYLINAGMVYSIARKLNCRKNLCLIAALLYLAMPIAFAEALTTQNDNFATVWLLYFTYILLDFTDMGKRLEWKRDTISKVCMLGMLVSLGYLTKPSVCIGMAVMVLWLLAVCILRRDRISVLAKLISVTIPTIILPTLPEILRNIKTFSAISAPIAGQRQLIGTLNPLYVFINFLKNFLYNLPNVYIYSSDYLLTRIVEKAANFLRVNLNDPSISEDARAFVMHKAPAYGHDTALNPVIVGLMILCIIFGMIRILKRDAKGIFLSYSFVSVACFLIFCCMLRWEPYVSRYMSAYLALLCPMIALQLEKINGERIQSAIIGIICFVCIAEICSMVLYYIPYVPKEERDRAAGYFVKHAQEYEIYDEFRQIIEKEGFREIGLKMGEEDFEYPLWKMLEEDITRIEHVHVDNATVRYDDLDFVPDGIIWVGELPKEDIVYNGKVYNNRIGYEEKYYLLW